MERDPRRDHGEWRGCHKFDKIICDGDMPTSSERRGGLKMGQQYYYYYEVDGTTETHNPSLPTTTACPFLPGQTVNTLDVPVERSSRLKSASMNSLRSTDYKTMDPVDRFTAPRPAPVLGNKREFHIASASSILPKRATRSVSPGPSWTGTARRILGFKIRDRDAERGRKSALSEQEDVLVEDPEPSTETRSVTPSGSIRSRELSPESLRRFLSDDLPGAFANTEPAPGFSIPDDIEEEIEDNEDDDNFASTGSDNTSFTTLSPPPFRQGGLSAPPASHTRTVIPTHAVLISHTETASAGKKRSRVVPPKLDIPRSHSAISITSSSLASAASPISNISKGLSQFSFFDDSDDDEDLASYEGDQTVLGGMKQNHSMDKEASDRGLRAPITSYSLPQASTDSKSHLNANDVLPSLESPALVARNDNGLSVDRFGLPSVEIGLDDFNWVIRQKEL